MAKYKLIDVGRGKWNGEVEGDELAAWNEARKHLASRGVDIRGVFRKGDRVKVDIKIEPRKPPIVILEAETENEEESLQLLAGFPKLRFRLLIDDEELVVRR